MAVEIEGNNNELNKDDIVTKRADQLESKAPPDSPVATPFSDELTDMPQEPPPAVSDELADIPQEPPPAVPGQTFPAPPNYSPSMSGEENGVKIRPSGFNARKLPKTKSKDDFLSQLAKIISSKPKTDKEEIDLFDQAFSMKSNLGASIRSGEFETFYQKHEDLFRENKDTVIKALNECKNAATLYAIFSSDDKFKKFITANKDRFNKNSLISDFITSKDVASIRDGYDKTVLNYALTSNDISTITRVSDKEYIINRAKKKLENFSLSDGIKLGLTDYSMVSIALHFDGKNKNNNKIINLLDEAIASVSPSNPTKESLDRVYQIISSAGSKIIESKQISDPQIAKNLLQNLGNSNFLEKEKAQVERQIISILRKQQKTLGKEIRSERSSRIKDFFEFVSTGNWTSYFTKPASARSELRKKQEELGEAIRAVPKEKKTYAGRIIEEAYKATGKKSHLK